MIAVDTSSAIAFLAGETGEDIDRISEAMDARSLRLPPPVISELLSSPRHASLLGEFLSHLPLLPILDGYWDRVGTARALLIGKGLRARLPDALIAQACIDSGVALITRDVDYRHFARWCGLKLAG